MSILVTDTYGWSGNEHSRPCSKFISALTSLSASRRRVWKGKMSHRTSSSQNTKRVAESTAPSLRLTPA